MDAITEGVVFGERRGEGGGILRISYLRVACLRPLWVILLVSDKQGAGGGRWHDGYGVRICDASDASSSGVIHYGIAAVVA